MLAKFLVNFPAPVMPKRFLAELLDFNFGILIPFKNGWIVILSGQACQFRPIHPYTVRFILYPVQNCKHFFQKIKYQG